MKYILLIEIVLVTVDVTRKWAGVDTDWKQTKNLEPEKCSSITQSPTCRVRAFLDGL
jgi:hypothetical protein